MGNETNAQRPQMSALDTIKALLDQVYLRDVLLLINTASNPYDRAIVEKLINNENPDSGEWAHIFDEALKLKLPDRHNATLEKIHRHLNAASQNSVAAP